MINQNLSSPSHDGLFFPELQTNRLLLRQLVQEDLEFVYRHFKDVRVAEFLLDEAPVVDYDQAQAIIDFYQNPETKTHNRWALVRRSDGLVIGTCGFHKWSKDNHRVEIGYDLTPECWGQGYMREGMQAAIDNGFKRMGVNRIEAVVHRDNQRSLKLLDRLGFKREGLMRDYYYYEGHYYDHWLLSLLKRDWESDLT